jgi:two-component system sensor kinase FixL
MPLQQLENRTRFILAAILICAVALVDWRVEAPITFGFLYLFPVMLLGTAGRRWPVMLAAAICTVLADQLDPFPLSLSISLPQGILVFTALTGTGLFAYEVTRSRRLEMENMRKIRQEAGARRAAEEQLEFLIDSSPAAILTTGPEGGILLANAAAHRLFAVPAGVLPGRNASRYLPALGCVPSIEHAPQGFRTGMQCRGVRDNGEVFLANVFFSTYRTAMGPRLAALVVDASEELREREESSLEQLMAGSRILVGAVSHEVRNVCGAIAVIHENLVRGSALEGNKDFEALGSLVETLNRIASIELKQSAAEPQTGGIDLLEVLDDLRIVLEPCCEDAGITLSWRIPRDLPPVLADRHSLMQVLLNLTKNSERALENAGVKGIDISVSEEPRGVAIRVTDTGPGIAHPENLFQPFQRGAGSTGLGLFLSRAFVRSFRGDLRHDPAVPGCSFVIELAKAGIPAEAEYGRAEKYGANPAVIAR